MWFDKASGAGEFDTKDNPPGGGLLDSDAEKRTAGQQKKGIPCAGLEQPGLTRIGSVAKGR